MCTEKDYAIGQRIVIDVNDALHEVYGMHVTMSYHPKDNLICLRECGQTVLTQNVAGDSLIAFITDIDKLLHKYELGDY